MNVPYQAMRAILVHKTPRSIVGCHNFSMVNRVFLLGEIMFCWTGGHNLNDSSEFVREDKMQYLLNTAIILSHSRSCSISL